MADVKCLDSKVIAEIEVVESQERSVLYEARREGLGFAVGDARIEGFAQDVASWQVARVHQVVGSTVIYLITDGAAQYDAHRPVLVVYVGCDAVRKVWHCATDLAYPVAAVIVLAIALLAIDDAQVLLAPEGTDRVTLLDALRIRAREALTLAGCGEHVVARPLVVREAGHLIGVVAHVERDVPTPVLGADDVGCNLKLDTLVLYRTHVGNLAGDERRCRHIDAEQQVIGLLVVPVEAATDAAVEETKVKSDVVLGGLLPLQVGIRILCWQDDGDLVAAYQIAVRRSCQCVERLVVADFLVAGDTEAVAKLQVVHGFPAPEMLLADAPRCCCRREEAPLVVGTESARSVATHGSCEQVAVVVVVVYASVERDELVALHIARRSIEAAGSTDVVVFELVRKEALGRREAAVVLEVLVRITVHGVDIVLVELLVVLQDEVEQLGVVLHLLHRGVAVQTCAEEVVLRNIRVTAHVVVAVAQVGVEGQWTPEVVVSRKVADELACHALVLYLFEERNGVDTIRTHIHIVAILTEDGQCWIEDVGLIQCTSTHFRTHGTRDRSLRSVLLVVAHVEVNLQAIVEGSLVDVHTAVVALQSGVLDDTVLVGIAQRSTITGALRTVHQRYVVALREAYAHQFVLPVGVGATILKGDLVGGIEGLVDVAEGTTIFVSVQHVEFLGIEAPTQVQAVVELLHALLALLGGDDDDAVGTTRTVDGGGRSVLQYVDALDILGVNHRKGIHCFKVECIGANR